MDSNLKELNQLNDFMEHEQKFDSISELYICKTMYPLPLATVSLWWGNSYRSTIVSGMTYIWDSGATNIMIKSKHNNIYERRIRSNKVKYSTDAGLYVTAHDVKLPFWMPEFSGSKIILHLFHVYIDEGNLVIFYSMIVVQELMEKLGLTDDFKIQVISWYNTLVPTKKPRSLI